MKNLLLTVLFTLCATFMTSQGATPSTPVYRGKFYLHVDDSVTIFLNGAKVYHANWGVATSQEVPLSPGDRMVLKLHNAVGPRGLKMLFVSSDRKTAIHFATKDFRLWRDPEKFDFTHAEFNALAPAKKQKPYRTDKTLVFNTTAEWVWGESELGDCFLACEVDRFMFTTFQP